MLLRDSMAASAIKSNIENQRLVDQLESLNAVLGPIEKVLSNCKEEANLTAKRYGVSFVAMICFQFFLSQYGTYVAFSWDVMEPITAIVTLSDAMTAYFFWLWAGRPWSLDSIRIPFFNRRVDRLLKKNHLDKEHYKALYQARLEILNKLYN